jgi:hypothetical protein
MQKESPGLRVPGLLVPNSQRVLIAAPYLFHAAIISPNGNRPAAMASKAALIAVVAVSAVPTPTGSAGVNVNAAGAYMHTLSKGRCRCSESQCAYHSKRSERCLKPHRVSPFPFLFQTDNTNGAALVPGGT